MTKEQIAVFIAEHKWDYRRELYIVQATSGSADVVAFSLSFRLYCCAFGNSSIYRIDLLSVQQSWSRDVGSWYGNI